MDSNKMPTSLKVSGDKIFLSLEEKDLLEEFKVKYGFKSSDIEFKIESMFSESFFEVLPYFQLKIVDIIKALIPSLYLHLIRNYLIFLLKQYLIAKMDHFLKKVHLHVVNA